MDGRGGRGGREDDNNTPVFTSLEVLEEPSSEMAKSSCKISNNSLKNSVQSCCSSAANRGARLPIIL